MAILGSAGGPLVITIPIFIILIFNPTDFYFAHGIKLLTHNSNYNMPYLNALIYLKLIGLTTVASFRHFPGRTISTA